MKKKCAEQSAVHNTINFSCNFVIKRIFIFVIKFECALCAHSALCSRKSKYNNNFAGEKKCLKWNGPWLWVATNKLPPPQRISVSRFAILICRFCVAHFTPAPNCYNFQQISIVIFIAACMRSDRTFSSAIHHEHECARVYDRFICKEAESCSILWSDLPYMHQDVQRRTANWHLVQRRPSHSELAAQNVAHPSSLGTPENKSRNERKLNKIVYIP